MERAGAPGGPFQLLATLAGGPYSDGGLVPGAVYYYRVTAVERAG